MFTLPPHMKLFEGWKAQQVKILKEKINDEQGEETNGGGYISETDAYILEGMQSTTLDGTVDEEGVVFDSRTTMEDVVQGGDWVLIDGVDLATESLGRDEH